MLTDHVRPAKIVNIAVWSLPLMLRTSPSREPVRNELPPALQLIVQLSGSATFEVAVNSHTALR